VSVAGWGLETDDGMVSFVRITGIAPACNGAEMFANITGTGGTELTEAGPALIDSDTETLDFDTDVSAVSIEDLHVFIEGPSA
jgi:hypothetical protein